MATKPPSDADIFGEDDDDSSPTGGGGKDTTDPKPKASTPTKKSASASTAAAKSKKPVKTKIGGKDFYDDLAYELQNRLVKAPKIERDKVTAAMAALSGPGLTTAERVAYKKVIADASKNLKKIEEENKEYVKNRNRFQSVKHDSGARLTAVREYTKKNQSSLSKAALNQLKQMEKDLLDAVRHPNLSSTDHEANEHIVSVLEKIEKQSAKLPKDLKKRFDDIEEKAGVLMTAQEEAASMVAETNAKIKDFGKKLGMGVLDRIGLGSFNAGNAVRLGAKAYRGVKAVKGAANYASDYFKSRAVLKQDDPSVDLNEHLKDTKSTRTRDKNGRFKSGGSDSAAAGATPVPISPQAPAIPEAEYDPEDPLTHPRKKRGAKLTSPTQNMDAGAEARAAIERAQKKARKHDQIRKQQAAEAKSLGVPGPRMLSSSEAKTRREEERKQIEEQLEKLRDFQNPNRGDADKVGAFKAGSMSSVSVADTTKQSSNEAKFDPDKVGAFHVSSGKISSAKPESTVKPIQVAQTSSSSSQQSEENSEKSSDYQEDSLKEAERLNDILDKHASSQDRFNSRLLSELRGRSKPAAQQSSGLGSTISDLASSIGGLGKMLPGLMGMLGKGLAVAAAWEAGQFVGKKIYEKYGDNIQSGLEKATDFGSHLLGKKSNNDKIEDMLAGKGDYAPKPKSAGAGASSPSSSASGKGPSVTPVSLNSTAGAGRGSMNPGMPSTDSSSAETPPVPSSAPSPILSDSSGGGGDATPVQLPQATSGADAGSGMSSMGSPDSSQMGGKSSDKDGSGGGKVRDFMGKLFSKGSSVNVDGIHPKMQDTLVRMGQEYFQATGKKLNFNSAFRSMEEQAQLYKTKPPGMAGKPGGSLHNFGLAVDIPSVQANELDKLGLLGKYGFTRPIPNEKWHIQPAGISVAAAKSGIFSADAPSNQGQPPATQTASAQQQAPGVTNASYEVPKSAGAGGTQMASASGGGGSSGGSMGGTRVSASSIPTFDGSDGAFLALNTGII